MKLTVGHLNTMEATRNPMINQCILIGINIAHRPVGAGSLAAKSTPLNAASGHPRIEMTQSGSLDEKKRAMML